MKKASKSKVSSFSRYIYYVSGVFVAASILIMLFSNRELGMVYFADYCLMTSIVLALIGDYFLKERPKWAIAIICLLRIIGTVMAVCILLSAKDIARPNDSIASPKYKATVTVVDFPLDEQGIPIMSAENLAVVAEFCVQEGLLNPEDVTDPTKLLEVAYANQVHIQFGGQPIQPRDTDGNPIPPTDTDEESAITTLAAVAV